MGYLRGGVPWKKPRPPSKLCSNLIFMRDDRKIGHGENAPQIQASSRTRMPSAMRYTPNGAKPHRLTTSRQNRIAARDTTYAIHRRDSEHQPLAACCGHLTLRDGDGKFNPF